MYKWRWWRRVFPPEILPFHAALVLSALTWLLVLHLSSVSILVLIMPPIKIYIESYNATRSHASDQSPGKAETALGVTQIIDVAAILHKTWSWSQSSPHLSPVFTGIGLKCIRGSPEWNWINSTYLNRQIEYSLMLDKTPCQISTLEYALSIYVYLTTRNWDEGWDYFCVL